MTERTTISHFAIGERTDASGGTAFGEIIATPTNSVSTPAAIASRRVTVSTSSTNIEYPSSATATAMTTRAMYGTYGARRPGGSVAPSRTAEIGGTRVALSAGKSPARRVTRIPTARLVTTVR